ncbi:MAG: secretin and TonB N-terminal domain-containing protein [Candidatus Methylomirabilis oxyfera]|nr:secretin and TonB N-terminal domain-containing protein [Candidatus Methylomirabilis oxyfera]
MTRADNISISRKRWLAGAVLFVFSTSCAAPGVSTNRTPQQSLSNPSSPVGSAAARVVDITDVQVRAEGPGHTSIIVTADGALVDYASFTAHTPPSLTIDLSHARDAISRAVIPPSDSPVLRVEAMQLQHTPNPVVRLKFDLNHLLPYRVELTGNGLQILVGPEVSEHARVAQEPAQLKQTVEPVVSPVESPVVSPGEPAHTEPSRAASSPAVLPPAAKEDTPPPPPQRRAAPATAKGPSRKTTGEPEQGPSPSPSATAKPPITAATATPTVAAANKRLSLDFKGADLDDLLRLISEVSGLNVVVAHGLKDRRDRDVTVRLNNVEWRQALDVILRAKGLSYEQDGNLIYVGSKSEIQKSKEERAKDIEQTALKELRIEEEKRRVQEARQKVEDERRRTEEKERRYAEEPPCTRVIRVAYMKASDLKKHLERLKTRQGSIDLEETTNTLIVNDVQSVCLKMTSLAKELDAPPKDPFVTKLLPFNYAKATDLKTHLTALKTMQGSVIVDERSSRIIVKDLPEVVERIEAFLKQIDIPTPQVLIEARIVEATRQFSQSLGIQWGGTGIPTSAGSTTGVTAFGGSTAGSIRFPTLTPTPGTPFPTTTGGGIPFVGPVPLALNLPVTSPHFALGMTIGSLANRFLVGAQLSAAENQGKIRTLSSPRVATQDNEEAEIKQGTQVPFTTIDSSGRTVVQFQDAFIKLKVKPHITPDGRVAMKVEAERSFPGQRVDFSQGFVFPINTRKATTNIMIQNGSTVVIGGLLQSTETIITDQMPVLGDIPFLGWLFKRRAIGPDERVELLIFLTPSVLQESRL